MMKTMLPLLLVLGAALLPSSVEAQGDSFIHFQYSGYQEARYFPEYESLLGDEILKTCVKREYPPVSGGPCRDIPKTCLWGSQMCEQDGLEPTTRCNCKDDKWSCQSFFCPTIQPVCPAKDPSAERPAPICKTDMKCPYHEPEPKYCDYCQTVAVPAVTCACQAGQPLTCSKVDVCSNYTNCIDLEIGIKNGVIYPAPDILEFKLKKDPPKSLPVPKGKEPSQETVENPAGCPAEEPLLLDSKEPATFECMGTGYECDYGYSCCCPGGNGTACSSDLKCDCVEGVLTCTPKTCDAFLCVQPPELLHSPFPGDSTTNNVLCPAEETADALHADEAKNSTSCDVTEQEDFYHCVYGFSCCCPSDTTDPFNFDGRFCSSELQCSCSAGVFTCDSRTCPACDTIVLPGGVTDSKVVCPAILPDQGETCLIAEGDTCGFGEQECCDGAKHAKHYCTCEGGAWDCFDATYLCLEPACAQV